MFGREGQAFWLIAFPGLDLMRENSLPESSYQKKVERMLGTQKTILFKALIK